MREKRIIHKSNFYWVQIQKRIWFFRYWYHWHNLDWFVDLEDAENSDAYKYGHLITYHNK